MADERTGRAGGQDARTAWARAEEIVLLTDLGTIVLAGEGLHIVKLNLDDGVLEAEGRILALEYADEPKMGKKGFLSGLFK